MIKIDLITGFLGAGKTTFIKKYAAYLLGKGEKICIVENDYGAVNVDMLLLKELLSDNCNLEMIVGGDGKTAHQRRFRSKLISMAMSGYSRVIVEPSGVYDVDEFFDVLYEEPLDNWYEIGSVISIIDALAMRNLSKVSEYLFMSEICWAGKVIVSRLDGENSIEAVIDMVNRILAEYGCNVRFTSGDFISGDPDSFSDKKFESLISAGYKRAEYKKLPVDDDKYTSLFYFDTRMDMELLKEKIKDLFDDENAGKVIRIKGSVRISDSEQLEVNATCREISLNSVKCPRDILIVIGEGLNKEYINSLFKDYCSIVSL